MRLRIKDGASSQKLLDSLRRSAQDCAVAAFDYRALQKVWVLDHEADYLVVG